MLSNKNTLIPKPERWGATYFWITLVSLVIFVVLGRLPPQRVGDGMEYYAMLLAWKDTLRPWMSAPSFAAYQQLFESNHIAGMMPAQWLYDAFPSLRLNGTSDFNHFWFYSFLAFLFVKLVNLVGLSVGPHGGFLILHFVLFNTAAVVAYYLYGRRGLVVFVLMTLFSPMLWFSDKVHTEFFTYCVTFMGVMFVFARRYLLGAFCIALAATQNPSFAIISFIPFVYRFVLEWRVRFTVFEVCLLVGTAFAVLAHPTYYFLRFGVLTPQLLAGGASLGSNLSTFYIWILDPDLGLLPNWPLGVFLILVAIIVRRYGAASVALSTKSTNVAFYVFLLIFVLVNFYAHSSTTNLNSGATPGLARYSLWYLPAFFPVVYYVVSRFPDSRVLAYPLVLVIFLIGVVSILNNNPKRHEQYSEPTWLSNAIQTKLPFLYTPPSEVFVERYSGVGEAIYSFNPRGVLGPDCHKLMIFTGQGRSLITVPSLCQMDAKKLQVIVDGFPPEPFDHFVTLDSAQYKEALLTLKPQPYLIGSAVDGNFALGNGWYGVEQWGAWSRKKVAMVSLPCNEGQFYVLRDSLSVSLDLRGFGTQPITITHNGDVLYAGSIDAPKTVQLKVKVAQCKTRTLDLEIKVAHPISPAEIGQSADQRQLGVGISGFSLQP